MLAVIFNPASGDRSAKAFLDEQVLPLLATHTRSPDIIRQTERPGHASDILAELLNGTDGELTIILLSGDGTLHEMINPMPHSTRTVLIALVPCGTANALYSSLYLHNPSDDPVEYRLRAIKDLITNPQHTIPFTQATTQFISADNSVVTTINAAVVASTSLHASILHDSEALRAEIPGIERFKIAAQQNLSRWYQATAKLSSVGQYDPATKKFVALGDTVVLQGPFAYFLSVVNVDRLEPAFRIAPNVSQIPERELMDVVAVRPLRDPSISTQSLEAREAFAAKSMQVLLAAYQDGAHVNLRYAPDGSVVPDASGLAVVEYFRCSKWEWIPTKEDAASHLVCTDGLITTIPELGHASCSVGEAATHLRLYASAPA